METLELSLTMVRTPEDQPLRSKAFQRELRDFIESLEASGFKVGVTIELIEAAAGPDVPTYLGQFAIELAKNPLVGGAASAVVGFFAARYGRKVRLTLGNSEIEETEKQVRNLLKKPEEFQQRNRSEAIGES